MVKSQKNCTTWGSEAGPAQRDPAPPQSWERLGRWKGNHWVWTEIVAPPSARLW